MLSSFDWPERSRKPYFSESVLANTVSVVPLKSRSSVEPPRDEMNS